MCPRCAKRISKYASRWQPAAATAASRQLTLDSAVSNAKNKKSSHVFFLRCRCFTRLSSLSPSYYLAISHALRTEFYLFYCLFPLRKTHIITSRFSRRVVGLHSCIYVCLAIYKRWRNKTKKSETKWNRSNKKTEWIAMTVAAAATGWWQAFYNGYKIHVCACVSHRCETIQTIEPTKKTVYKNWRTFRFYFALVLCRVDAPFVRLFFFSRYELSASQVTSSVWDGNAELSRKIITCLQPTTISTAFVCCLHRWRSSRGCIVSRLSRVMVQPFIRFTRQFRLPVYARNNIRIMLEIYFHFWHITIGVDCCCCCCLCYTAVLLARTICRHARTRASQFTLHRGGRHGKPGECRMSSMSTRYIYRIQCATRHQSHLLRA